MIYYAKHYTKTEANYYLLKSYLFNRSFIIKIQGEISNIFKANAGVPRPSFAKTNSMYHLYCRYAYYLQNI